MAASATIPALNASRSPRKANWRGKKPSRARIDDEAREVGEARLGRQDEDAHRREDQDVVQRRPSAEHGRADLAEDRVARPRGRRPVTPTSQLIPRNIDAQQRRPSISIVVWAFFHSGGLNAGTPLATASVPVIAEQPSANARISEQEAHASRAGPEPASRRGRCGGSPITVRTIPRPIMSSMLPRKMYVGSGEDRPALAHAAQVDGHHQQDADDDQRDLDRPGGPAGRTRG